MHDNPLHINPRHAANSPKLNGAATARLQLVIPGVVDELKDARLHIAAAIEEFARERFGASSGLRGINGFVGDLAPLTIGAKPVAPGFVFFGELALTAVAVDHYDAIVAALIVVTARLAGEARVVDVFVLLVGVDLIGFAVVGAVGGELFCRGFEHLLAVVHRLLEVAVVGGGGGLDLDVDDEVESVVLTGFGEVDAVAAGGLLAFLAVGGVFVMRGFQGIGANPLGAL